MLEQSVVLSSSSFNTKQQNMQRTRAEMRWYRFTELNIVAVNPYRGQSLAVGCLDLILSMIAKRSLALYAPHAFWCKFGDVENNSVNDVLWPRLIRLYFTLR